MGLGLADANAMSIDVYSDRYPYFDFYCSHSFNAQLGFNGPAIGSEGAFSMGNFAPATDGFLATYSAKREGHEVADAAVVSVSNDGTIGQARWLTDIEGTPDITHIAGVHLVPYGDGYLVTWSIKDDSSPYGYRWLTHAAEMNASGDLTTAPEVIGALEIHSGWDPQWRGTDTPTHHWTLMDRLFRYANGDVGWLTHTNEAHELKQVRLRSCP